MCGCRELAPPRLADSEIEKAESGGRQAPRHKSSQTQSSPTRAALIARLYRAIDAKLAHMETQMAIAEPMTPADNEREVRALGALITNFEKVTEFETDRAPPSRSVAGQSAAAAEAALLDPERLRHEIAQRFAALLDKRNAPGDAGGPAAG